MGLPKTIKHKNAFINSPSAGFDGVFDWSWTDGCFGDGKITPMDFDGVVERKGNFILFETKDIGVPVPKGQLYTLESAHRLGCFTILLLYGKTKPESAQIWYPGVTTRQNLNGIEEIKQKVANWYEYANKNPKKSISDEFLSRRIVAISEQNEERGNTIKRAKDLAEQLLKILEGAQ